MKTLVIFTKTDVRFQMLKDAATVNARAAGWRKLGCNVAVFPYELNAFQRADLTREYLSGADLSIIMEPAK